MIVDKANFEDANAIAENNILLAKESENITIDYETVLKGVKNLISNEKNGFYLIAKNNKNKIIGQLMITYEWSDWHNNLIWWIQSVYVVNSFRKKGVLKQLFNSIKNRAIENNIDTLRLYVYKDNLLAKKAYEKIKMSKKPYEFFEYKI